MGQSSNSFARFEYVRDGSAFGQATPPRPNLPFSRHCFGEYCPGSSEVPFAVDNHTYNSHIPTNLTRIFSSGTLNDQTVSGLFDIQYRLWTTQINFDAEGGEAYPVGAFRTVQSFLHHNTTEIVEGLVVDNVNGGVGYRNHSMPVGLKYGATWSEDLTWIEPVTECINTNLSYHLVLNLSDSKVRTYLRDDGGFTNLAKDEPYPGHWDDGQNLNLRARAYRAAWLHNRLGMINFNLTSNESTWNGPGSVNSFVGEEFGIQEFHFSIDSIVGRLQLFRLLNDMDGMRISTIDGGYLGGGFWEGIEGSDNFDEALSKLAETLDLQSVAQATHFGYVGK